MKKLAAAFGRHPSGPASLALVAVLAAGLAAELAVPGPAAAASPKRTPGATLIVPYFEVDLDEPDGRTTLVTVGNVGEPVIAHATVWTDWGIPVYSWDLYLGHEAFVTYNLRDLLVTGTLPPTGGPIAFPCCANPVATPPPADLPFFQRMLSGQPTFPGGLYCGSEPREDTSLASGAITIDTVRRCSSGQVYPTSNGYYDALDETLASPHSDLWGDFTLVDPAENYAQGFEAYALGIAAGSLADTFGDMAGRRGIAREGLSTGCSRMRFLEGGPFAAHTSLFVYTAPSIFGDLGEHRCSPPGFRGDRIWLFGLYDEEGHHLGDSGYLWHHRYSGRIELADLGFTSGGGYLALRTDWAIDISPPLPATPTQHLILGTIQASGRFAVGTGGADLGETCN